MLTGAVGLLALPNLDVAAVRVGHDVMDGAGTAAVLPEPDWLAQGPAAVRSIYAWAAGQRAALQYIPCYCGCGTNNGHQDNFTCYFRTGADGSVTGYEEHGFG